MYVYDKNICTFLFQTNICLKCRAASNVILNEFKNRTNLDKVEQVLFCLCDLLTDLSDTVCRGYANIYTVSKYLYENFGNSCIDLLHQLP